MAERRIIKGWIVERQADGTLVPIAPADGGGQPPADPGFQYEGPKAQADLTSTTLTNQQKQQELEDTRRGKLPMGYRWGANGNAEVIPGVKDPNKPGLTAEDRAKAQNAYTTLPNLAQGILDLRAQYNKHLSERNPLEGRAGSYLRPQDNVFDDTSGSLSAFVATALGLSGQQFNTPAEQQLFIGSILPKSSDNDEQILAKMQRLDQLLSNARIKGGQTLGIDPAADPLAQYPAIQSYDATNGGRKKRDDVLPEAQTSILNPIGGTPIDQGPNPALGPGQKFAYDEGGKPIGILNADGSWGGGYSQIDGTDINAAASAAAEQRAADAAARDNAMGGADAYGRNFANAWTAGGADKISAAVNSVIPVDALFGADVKSVWGGNSLGDAYRANLGVQERTNGADRRSNPLPSFAGDVSGSLAGMVTANRILGGLGAGGMVARTGGAAGDVAYGTVRGGVENGPQGALLGGAAAVAGNLGGRYVLAPTARAVADTRAGRGLIDAARRGGNAVGNARRGLFGQAPVPHQPANIPPPLPRGERTAMARLPDDAEAQLNEAARMGLPMAVADLSPELQMLTGSAVRKSTAARDMAENTLRPRQLGQADRAQEQIARNFGPVDNPNEISDQLLQQARDSSRPLYQAFEAQPARTSDELAAMLQTPAGQRALQNARNMAANEQRDPNAMGFDLDQEGNVILRSDPSPETLDLVKRGFDDVINDYRDPTSGRLNLNDQGRTIEGLRQRFVGEVDRLYPNYADARRAYAGPAGEREALQTGRDMANAHPRDIQPRMQGMTPGQQGQFRLGQRVALSDSVDRARLTTNPYERVFGSPVAQARASTVFGPGPAANFQRAYEIEGNMARTAQEALGGSPTAARQAADEAFDGFVGDALDAGGSLVTGGGGIGGMGQRLMRGGRDYMRLRGGQQRGAELAPLLLNTDPAAMSALIARLRQASALRNNYVQRTRQAGGIFGASLGTGAALSGQ